MLDARIEFDPSDEARLKAALKRISPATTLGLTDALATIGDSMLEQFQRSFERQASPAGIAWAPLAPRTQQAFLAHRHRRQVTTGQRRRRRRTAKQRERRGGDHILQARAPGWLLRNLSMKVEPFSLAVGALGRVGGAAFRAEFGTAHEPSRPFVQLTDPMESQSADAILSRIEDRWF